MYSYRTKVKDLYYDQVIKLYTKKHLSYRGIAKIVPVAATTISRWIATFAEEHPQVTPRMSTKKISSNKTSLSDSGKSHSSQDQIAYLREQLRQEKLRADALDRMIDIAESTYNFSIRKKSGAKR